MMEKKTMRNTERPIKRLMVINDRFDNFLYDSLCDLYSGFNSGLLRLSVEVFGK